MRLSDMAHHLKKQFPGTITSILKDHVIVRSLSYTQDHGDLGANTLVVIDENDVQQLTKTDPDCCFAVILEHPTDTSGISVNGIVLPGMYSSKQVHSAVKEILESYIAEHDVISDLYRCIGEFCWLDSLMDKAFMYLNNPIIYYDYLHHVKAFRKGDYVENTLWEKDIELGHLDFENLDDTSYLCFEKLIADGESEFMVNDHRCRAYTIKQGNRLLGFIAILEYYQPFGSTDYRILSVLRDIIAGKSVQNPEVHGPSHIHAFSDIFSALLDRDRYNKDMLDGLLKTRRWKHRSRYRILLFTDEHKDTCKYSHYIAHRFSKIIGLCAVTCFESYVAVLEGMEDGEEPARSAFLEKQFAHTQLSLGVSDPFEKLSDAGEYAQQAKKALELHKKSAEGSNGVCYYEQVRLKDFFLECHRSFACGHYYHRSAAQLQSYDQLHHTELAKTLFFYLKNNKSVKKTSHELNVHKNTVTYRIQCIKDLLDSDLDNEEENFHRLLTFKLMGYSSQETPQL